MVCDMLSQTWAFCQYCAGRITGLIEAFLGMKTSNLVCMQDRHTIVKELMPDPSEPWASSLVNLAPRGFAAVYDGHKQSKPAEMAAERMQAYLAKYVGTIHAHALVLQVGICLGRL